MQPTNRLALFPPLPATVSQMGRAQELRAATVDGVIRTALAMISWLWAPAVVCWAAQHVELAQQKFVTTFLLAAVAAAATFTWYVYAV